MIKRKPVKSRAIKRGLWSLRREAGQYVSECIVHEAGVTVRFHQAICSDGQIWGRVEAYYKGRLFRQIFRVANFLKNTQIGTECRRFAREITGGQP